MSRLEYYARPLVAFDPENKEHRRYYYDFVTSGAWGRCPVRFICPTETGSNLIVMMQKQMLEYYVRKEFTNEKQPKHIRKKSVMGLTAGGKGSIKQT